MVQKMTVPTREGVALELKIGWSLFMTGRLLKAARHKFGLFGFN